MRPTDVGGPAALDRLALAYDFWARQPAGLEPASVTLERLQMEADLREAIVMVRTGRVV